MLKDILWTRDEVKLNGDAVVVVVPNGFAPNEEPNPPKAGAKKIVLKKQ